MLRDRMLSVDIYPISSVKLRTYSYILQLCMRKPRLDWIRAVLADLEADAEHAPATFGILRGNEPASADVPQAHDRLDRTEAEDRRFCPSRRLIRIVATANS
jgi:hypothetical protein